MSIGKEERQVNGATSVQIYFSSLNIIFFVLILEEKLSSTMLDGLFF